MTIEHSEKWAEICFLLQDNIHQNIPEKDFESQVVRAIEVLGWREFKNEIERQPIVQLGREGAVRPDLIVRGNDKKCLIVIEIKRPLENITRDYVIGQLRSYMRQMKSDFGFLIGTDLRVYYDGSLNPHSDPILLERIDFEKASELGAEFVQIFNKSSLLTNGHAEYLNNKLRQFNKTQQVALLINQLTSFETKQKIIGFLRDEFADIDDETFSDALQQLAIEVGKKEETEHKDVRGKEARFPDRGKFRGRLRERRPEPAEPTPDITASQSRIADIALESRRWQVRLKHIYGVLYFMKQGFDFPSATHQTLKLFPEVQDYQTISDKCGRGFAGSVDTFVTSFHSGEMLDRLVHKFGLSDHDAEVFQKLLKN